MASTVVALIYPFAAVVGFDWTVGVLSLAFSVWPTLLFIAAVIPIKEDERWGSMWPLVGYDDVIDGIYTRGQWRIRFDEMHEIDVQKSISSGMAVLFGKDS